MRVINSQLTESVNVAKKKNLVSQRATRKGLVGHKDSQKGNLPQQKMDRNRGKISAKGKRAESSPFSKKKVFTVSRWDRGKNLLKKKKKQGEKGKEIPTENHGRPLWALLAVSQSFNRDTMHRKDGESKGAP